MTRAEVTHAYAIQKEIAWITEWGAVRGQIEHHEIELGLRDADQPTADPSWWKIHGSCERCAA